MSQRACAEAAPETPTRSEAAREADVANPVARSRAVDRRCPGARAQRPLSASGRQPGGAASSSFIRCTLPDGPFGSAVDEADTFGVL